MLINFADGIFTPKHQEELNILLNEITYDELNAVEKYLYELLALVGSKIKKRYTINYIKVIPLQLLLNNYNGPLQYGVHSNNNISIIDMSEIGGKKGKFGEILILAHEVGHALMGYKNYTIQQEYNTRLMEKMTDETIKMRLMDKFPNFYKMYCLCRNTHHYKTKEGDFKEFFKDIVSVLENKWKIYKFLHHIK